MKKLKYTPSELRDILEDLDDQSNQTVVAKLGSGQFTFGEDPERRFRLAIYFPSKIIDEYYHLMLLLNPRSTFYIDLFLDGSSKNKGTEKRKVHKH